ncbi:hypothetical protein KF397_004714 [Salmonella enterica subsp. enterica serovar Oranienburg]|nr:hypothetical protein [Salmonella enterica subsp. enterica serovar Oranienburg]
MKTALVFLAGDPVPSATTISHYPPVPRAYTGSKITITVSAADANGNVVPGWVLKNLLQVSPTATGVSVGKPVAKGADTASVEMVLQGSAEFTSVEIRSVVTQVNIGPNVSEKVPTPFLPYVNVCLTQDGNSGIAPVPGEGVVIGVAKWALCEYDKDTAGSFTYRRQVPASLGPTFIVDLSSNGFNNGDVRSQKLRFNTGLTWGQGHAPGGTQLSDSLLRVADITYARTVGDPLTGAIYDGKIDDPKGEAPFIPPRYVGFFARYDGWSSSDRDPGDMARSGNEVCTALGGKTGDAKGEFATDGNTASLKAARVIDPEVAGSTRVNTYSGSHEIKVLNGVPGMRDSGYFPLATETGELNKAYYFKSDGTVAVVTATGTLGENVLGAFCTAP